MKTTFRQFLLESPIMKLITSDDYDDVFGTLSKDSKQKKFCKVANQTDDLLSDDKKRAKYLTKLTAYLKYTSAVN